MKIGSSVLAIALLLVLAFAAGADESMPMPGMKMPPRSARPATKTNPSFEQLKSLAGSWEGKSSEGKAVKATYALVSSGTCVMETLNTPDGADMITMYHMSDDALMMHHYCAMNNVPHMKALSSKDPKHLEFKFVNATNLEKPTDMHMHGLSMTFQDKDHFSQQWTLRNAGNNQPVTFDFQRTN